MKKGMFVLAMAMFLTMTIVIGQVWAVADNANNLGDHHSEMVLSVMPREIAYVAIPK